MKYAHYFLPAILLCGSPWDPRDCVIVETEDQQEYFEEDVADYQELDS